MTATTMTVEEFKVTELGPLPPEWEVVRLGDVAKVSSGGSAPQGKDFFGGHNPFIRVQHLELESDTIRRWDLITDEAVNKCGLRLYSKGTIVFPKSGASIYLEKRAILPIDAYIVSHLCAVISWSSLVDQNFLFYYLRFTRLSEQKAEGYPTLNLTEIKERRIACPPFPEQKRIAYFLSTVQTAIEKTEAVIKAARALKKSLMKHLFTYGPVSIDEAESVLLKETEIGLVPEGWEVVRLDEVITEGIRNGAFVRRSNFGNGVIFLNVADTYSNVSADLRISERVQCTDEEFRLYEIKPGDLFYVRSSLKREGVGQCCVVEHIPEPSIYDCHLMRVRVDDERVIPKFLAYYSVSLPGKLSLISRSKTTTMTTINQRGLAYFAVPLPPIPTQREIANTLTAVDDKMQSEENKRQALEALFKTLLSSLMTGKIRVSNLEVSV